MTTPDSPELFRLLSQMKNSLCKYVLMEVSSQAADQKRISGINFKLNNKESIIPMSLNNSISFGVISFIMLPLL